MEAHALRTFAIRCANFSQSVIHLYATTGGRKLPLERIQARVSICSGDGDPTKKCDKFNGKGCDVCGCGIRGVASIFNKAAYPTERCPHPDSPRWLEEKLDA